MGDEIQFAGETYSGMQGSEAITGQQTTADATLLGGDACRNGSCTNTANPAEEAWVKLVSAIPVANQVQSFKCVAGGTAAPTPEEVQSLVSQIRPPEGDKLALQEIASHWMLMGNDFALNDDSAVAPILRNKLTDLSNGWQGTDFDAFAEQMEKVFANCERLAADIGNETSGIAGLLHQKGDEIYALQGGDSHELPYPAPQYWVEDKGGLFSNPKVHVRPPFTNGDCEVAEGCMFGDGDTEQAMELGGFDGDYANELSQYVTDQTEYHFAQLKAENPDTPEDQLRTQAADLAEQDANARAERDYDENSQDYEARAAEQNDTVVARWEDAEVSAMEFTPTVEPSGETTFRDSAGELDGSQYSPVTGGDFNASPTSSGTTGLNNPSSLSSFSGGTGGSASMTGANPWESTSGVDDDLSGGLASGGGLGASTMTAPGPGTGLGTGGAGAGGAGLGGGAGLFGPAVAGGMGSGTGAGRGAGSGLGKGQGLFGKTAGGGAGAGARGAGAGMMGAGGRGAGAGTEDEEGRATWLTEDEDVWGTARFNDDDDPLA